MRRPTAFTGAAIFDGHALLTGQALLVAGDRIVGLIPQEEVPAGTDRQELTGGTLAPGYVDLQVNGGGGRMFNDAPTTETLAVMASAHARLGATAILPTLITDRPEMTQAAVDAVIAACDDGIPGIAGLHLEGPHLSTARKGAHDPSLIRPMTDADVVALVEAAGRLPVLKITVAPETVSPSQIAELTKAKILVSLGHSDCGHDDARSAAKAGARCVTHLFNAMSPLGHREPGLVGAALATPELSAGLIADLVHVHPAAIRIALAAKEGPGTIFLVSDAMATAGSDITRFTLNGREIHRCDGRLTLKDGTLAGADLDITTAVRNLVGLGYPLADTLARATSGPAMLIGAQDRMGHLAPGRPADIIHLSDDLNLTAVWRQGTAQEA